MKTMDTVYIDELFLNRESEVLFPNLKKVGILEISDYQFNNNLFPALEEVDSLTVEVIEPSSANLTFPVLKKVKKMDVFGIRDNMDEYVFFPKLVNADQIDLSGRMKIEFPSLQNFNILSVNGPVQVQFTGLGKQKNIVIESIRIDSELIVPGLVEFEPLESDQLVIEAPGIREISERFEHFLYKPCPVYINLPDLIQCEKIEVSGILYNLHSKRNNDKSSNLNFPSLENLGLLSFSSVPFSQLEILSFPNLKRVRMIEFDKLSDDPDKNLNDYLNFPSLRSIDYIEISRIVESPEKPFYDIPQKKDLKQRKKTLEIEETVKYRYI